MWKKLFQRQKMLKIWENCLMQKKNLATSCAQVSSPKPISPNETKVECMMDLLPVPEGCWKEDYKRKNHLNNIILWFGVVNFFIALFAHAKTGFVPGYPEVGPFEKIYEMFNAQNSDGLNIFEDKKSREEPLFKDERLFEKSIPDQAVIENKNSDQ